MGTVLFYITTFNLLYFSLFTYFVKQLGFNSPLIISIFFNTLALIYVLLKHRYDKRALLKIAPILGIVYIFAIVTLMSDNEYANTKFMIMLARAIIPILVIMLFQITGYTLSKEFIYTSAMIYTTILIFNASQSNFMYRTSLNMEITQSSRIIMGAIEDSRALGISLIIALLLFKNTNAKYAFVAFMLFGMFVTQTRQALLALIAVGLPYILIFGSKQLHKSFKIFKYLPLIVVLVLMIQNFKPIQRVFLEVERINMLFYQKVSYIDNRADVRAFAIDSIIDKPIMGNGFGYTESQFTYPHNIILEILAEFGLIGLIVAAFILFRQWGIMRDKKSRALILYCLILAMFSGNITQNYLLYLFMFVDFNKLLQLNQKDIYATD